MKIMIIDIGSNTIKTDIFKTSKKSKIGYLRLAKESKSIKLIKYIENGVLSDKGKKKLFNMLSKYKKLAKRYFCKNIVCIATAGFRKISDSQEIISEIESSFKMKFHVLSGEMEAELSFLGMKALTENLANRGLMSDMGGGSTEIVGFSNDEIVWKKSCTFGCLYLKEKFVCDDFPSPNEADMIKKEVNSYLNNIENLTGFASDIYLVGGTAKALATLHSDYFEVGKKVHYPYVIEKTDIELLLSYYLDITKDKIKKLKEFFPDRYTLIIPGMISYLELFNAANIKTIHITSGGIRDGYMLSVLNEKKKEEKDD